MFLATLGQFEPKIETLTLEIENNEWHPIDSINGEYCEDCWRTSRMYHISAVTDETTYYCDHIVQFWVVPVQEDTVKKYKILRAYDMSNRKISRNNDMTSGISQSSWTEIKSIFK